MALSEISKVATCGTLTLAISCAHLPSPDYGELEATTRAARLLVTNLAQVSEMGGSCYEADRTVESALFVSGATPQSTLYRHGDVLSGPVPNPHVTRYYTFPDDQGRVIVELSCIAEEIGAHIIRVVFQSMEGFRGTIEQPCIMKHPPTQDGMRWK